jgi:hypothetical protein
LPPAQGHHGRVARRLDPDAKLGGFVAKDPYAAGCLITLEGVTSAEIA